jgi:hypothetical protein
MVSAGIIGVKSSSIWGWDINAVKKSSNHGKLHRKRSWKIKQRDQSFLPVQPSSN